MPSQLRRFPVKRLVLQFSFFTLIYPLRLRQRFSFRTEETFSQRDKQQQRNNNRHPQRRTSPIHRFDSRIRRNGKHPGHEEDDKEAKRETIDDVTRDLSQAKRRAVGKGAVDVDGVAVVETARDAEDIGAEKTAVADGLDVEKGGVRAEGDEGNAAADEPGQEYGVDGDV